MNPDRPQVGVEVELPPQRQEARLGPRLGIRVVPTRTTDGAEQDRVGSAARLERGRGQGVAVAVDGATTDGPFLERERVSVALGDGIEHLARFGDDLRPDPVPGQEDDEAFRHESSPPRTLPRSITALLSAETNARAEPSTTSVDTPRPEYVVAPTWMMTLTSAMASAPAVTGFTR